MTGSAVREWRDGWKMLVAAGFGVGLASAPVYSLGVFMAPLTHVFGWNRAQISGAITIMSVIVTLTSPGIGRLLDRWGARRISLLGTAVMCSAVASLALVGHSIWSYWAVWCVLAIGVAFASPLVWLMAVSNRFSARRGLMLSLALCGSNLTGAFAPILSEMILENFGWRAAYAGLGAFLFITCFPLAYWFFYDSHDLSHRVDVDTIERAKLEAQLATGAEVRQAILSANFWRLSTAFFLAGLGITAFVVHLVPMLTDVGISPLRAVSAESALSLAAIVGRLVAGLVMDRWFAPRVAAAVLAFPIVASLILIRPHSTYADGIIAASLIGLSIGAEFNMVAFLAAKYFGMRNFGAIHGLLYATFTAGAVIGPPLIGLLYLIHGNYSLSFETLAGTFMLASASMLLCTGYPSWNDKASTSGGLATL